jgi:hypothetical protein
MWKLPALCLALAGLIPGLADAVEVSKPRSTYGGFAGATRSDAKFLPGDVLFLEYEVRGLTVGEKSGTVSYYSVLEFFDAAGKSISEKKNPKQELVLQLGGSSVPGDLNAVMGDDQKPGKYKIKLSVYDNNVKDGKPAVMEYPFELLKKEFGVVQVVAPAFGVAGGNHLLQFGLIELPLDKNGDPSVDITFRVLDESSKKEVAKPVYMNYPKDMPDGVNLKKQNLAPVQFPMYLNRAGRYIVDVDIAEKLNKKNIKMQFPVNVIDFK